MKIFNLLNNAQLAEKNVSRLFYLFSDFSCLDFNVMFEVSRIGDKAATILKTKVPG